MNKWINLHILAKSKTSTLTPQWRIQRGQGGHAPRSPRPKFAVGKICRIQIFHRWKCKILCAKVQKTSASGELVPRPLSELGHWTTPGTFRSPASLATLSGNESLCFSLRLCYSNDVCNAPNSRRTRNQRHGFMAGWDWQNNFGPNLPLLFKMHEIWSVDSQKNY